MSMRAEFRGSFGFDTSKFSKSLMDKVVWKTALEIEKKAKELCPKRYGSLAASINVQMKDKGTDVEEPSKYTQKEVPENRDLYRDLHNINKPSEDGVAYIGTALDYAESTEYGFVGHDIPVRDKKMLSDMKRFYGTVVWNKGHEAQPFLRPALDYGDAEFENICATMRGIFTEEVAARLAENRYWKRASRDIEPGIY